MFVPRIFARTGWTPWHMAGGAALVALGFWVTWDAWQDIFRQASRQGTVGYLLLVPAIMAWLIWSRRERFRLCRPGGSLIGPIAVATGWLLSAWGDPAGDATAWHTGAVFVVVGCALAVAGEDLLRRFLPAFGVLLFVIPVPAVIDQHLIEPIRSGLVEVAWTLYRMVGIPAERHGEMLRIGGVDTQLHQTFAGVQTVMALWLVAYGFAFGKPLRSSARVLMLLLMPLVSVCLCMLGLVLTTWLFGQRMVENVYLLELGRWTVLGMSVLVLAGVLRVLVWASVPVRHYNLASES